MSEKEPRYTIKYLHPSRTQIFDGDRRIATVSFKKEAQEILAAFNAVETMRTALERILKTGYVARIHKKIAREALASLAPVKKGENDAGV